MNPLQVGATVVLSIWAVFGGLWLMLHLTGTEDEKQTVTAAFRRHRA